MKLSIVIPAYNEGNRISKTLEDYSNFFSQIYGDEFEVIVVLNGCNDNTLDVVKTYQEKCNKIKYLDFQQAGKGFAIMEGFKFAEGDLIGFIDADNSTEANIFNELIEHIENFDGIIASRYMEGSIVSPKQSIKRIILSRIFNFMIKALFFMNYKDTQCGAKIFRKDALKKIIPDLGTTAWAFDVDLLYQMKRHGFKIKELATTWSDGLYSKLNIWNAGPNMLFGIFKLRLIYSPFKFLIK